LIYFTSDTHFFDIDVINKLSDDRFVDVKTYNEFIVDQWNNIVNQDDVVWHLGDFSIPEKACIAQRLNGKINLILGNHDFGFGFQDERFFEIQNFYLDNGFAMVCQGTYVLEVESQLLYLSHLPNNGNPYPDAYLYDDIKPKDYMKPLICGHVHKHWVYNGHQINVSCCAWDFKPVELNILLDLI